MGKHYTDELEFVLDGVAESISDGHCTDLEVTSELRGHWATWRGAIRGALLDWAERVHCVENVEAILESEGEYGWDVYATLDGSGVGVWDGRWDGYFEEPDMGVLISKYFQQDRQLRAAFNEIERAVHNEAYTQCQKRKKRQRTLFDGVEPRATSALLRGVYPTKLSRPPR